MSLMARVDHARSGLQAANDRLSAARGLGKPKNEAPKEPEEKGFFDKMIDKAKNASLSDIVHTGLDVAGFIPGLGTVADLANAGLYLAEGDKVNAALAAAASVPGVGDALAAGKLAAKAAIDAGGAAAAVAAAKKLKNSAAVKVVDDTPRTAREGIYVLPATSGKPYVGESVDIDRRLGEHIKSGKLSSDNLSNVERTEVLGGKINREIAEQRKIDELGGIENLENKRNQIGPKRRHLLDE